MTDRRRAALMDAMELLESRPASGDQVGEARHEVMTRVRKRIQEGRFEGRFSPESLAGE
jgi:hypothetical protein